MIRLKEPGERGGYMVVEMTPFDLLSLQEGLSSASIHLQHLAEENPESFAFRGIEHKLKDVLQNYQELEKVLEHREVLLKQKGL